MIRGDEKRGWRAVARMMWGAKRFRMEFGAGHEGWCDLKDRSERERW